MNMIPVTLRPNPLEVATRTHVMRPGYTIAEMLAAYPERLPPGFYTHGVVTVEDTEFFPEWWPYVRIKDTGKVRCITLRIVPGTGGGGGSGGKNALAIVGAIAVIAASAWVGGAGIAFLGIAGGTVASQVAAAAIGIAGGLALNALAPPPISPKARQQQAMQGGNQLKYAGIQGNLLEPLATIPTVLGLIMASPPHLIRPYTKMLDKRVHAYACVGFAGFLDITNVRINGVDSTTLTDVTTHVVENGAAQTLALENVWEDQPNQELARHILKDDDSTGILLADQTTPANSYPKWHYFRTKGIPTKVRIRLGFPAGIFQISSTSGAVVTAGFPIKIAVRRVGVASWTLLPFFVFRGNGSNAQRTQITLDWTASTSGTLAAPGSPNTLNYDAVGRMGIGQAWAENSGSDYIVDATNNVKNVVRDGEQGWIIRMSTTTFPQTGEYEVRIMRGYHDQNLGSTDNWFGSVVDGSGNDVLDGGTTSNNNKTGNSTCIVESFACVRSGLPLDPTDLSYIEIEAEEFGVETITATWETKAGNWSGAAWGALEATPTNLCASLFRHILLNSRLNAEPLDASLLEQASGESLTTWYNDCVAASPDYTCNMVVDGMSVEQVLQIVAACGHAAVRRSDKWGVIEEKDRSASPIVQMFSPRNTWNNTVKVVFPDPPVDGLFITYPDSTDDYGINEATVTIAAGSNIEAIEYPGIVSLTRIQERARLDLRQRKFRNRFYSFNTDIQGIVSQRGDLVGYSFDVLEAVRQAARIRKVLFDGSGQATAVVMDELIDLAVLAAGSVGIVITRLDGTVTQKQVNMTGITAASPPQSTITFTSVIAGLGGNDADFIGAHAMIGVLNSEYRRCIVFDITWDSDLNSRMTLVDEAAANIYPLSA